MSGPQDIKADYFNDENKALQSKITSIANLASAKGYIIITATDDGKGGHNVFYSRQGLDANSTAQLMHAASRFFHEFDENEQKVKDLVAEDKCPAWLTDDVIAMAKDIMTSKGLHAPQVQAMQYLLRTAKQSGTDIPVEEVEHILNKYCK